MECWIVMRVVIVFFNNDSSIRWWFAGFLQLQNRLSSFWYLANCYEFNSYGEYTEGVYLQIKQNITNCVDLLYCNNLIRVYIARQP